AFALAAVVICLLAVAHSPAQERRKNEQDGSDSGTLVKKWDFVLMREVRLTRPSGWQYMMPWMVSSPAIGDLSGTLDLEVVTGTEEGSHDFQPLGEGVGRYVGLGSDGKFLWQYNTDNSAGRASPGIADLDGDGSQEVVGGSTSGWMIHLMNSQGKRLWRFPCPLRGNFLAAPAAGDLDGQPGFEIVGVTLWGAVYCLQADGKQLWSFTPGDGNSNLHWHSSAVASPVISDANDDGAPDVVVVLSKAELGERRNVVNLSPAVTCLDGRTGKPLWETRVQVTEDKKRTIQPSSYSSPAVVPMLDG
ncbi:MAG: PQQ-binding-like beta-propeller repeat protein, partial [Planctomycetota bacterium]|nr:PQQ-binding-like beta-propeller repeat protein [Planctomycetota bacterium]